MGIESLSKDEMLLVQSTVIERYKNIATQQNLLCRSMCKMDIPTSEIRRLMLGCANDEVKEAFRPPEPKLDTQPDSYNVFSQIVTFVRQQDSDRTAYGNTPRSAEELYKDFRINDPINK